MLTVTLFSSTGLLTVNADNNTGQGATPVASTATGNNGLNSNSNMSNSSSNNNNQNNNNNNQNNNNGQVTGTTQTKVHTLSTPYVVYGSGASSSAKSTLNSIFNVDSSFKTLTADAADYNKYINNGQPSGTTDAAMISSVALGPADPGSGVKVNIKPYNGQNNITKVTAQQYAMVAQMAGITDVTITVSANQPVSGESALTGVYVALAQDGAQLNAQNTSTANQMLQATQPAIDANKGNAQYPGELMAAVGNVSKQLAQMQQDNQQLATKQDIQDMLNKALQQQGIAKQTPQEQQTNITNALDSFQRAPIAHDKTYSKNVNNTIDNVKNSAGNVMNKAKNWANSKQAKQAAKEAEGWWHKFTQWVGQTWNNMFGNNKSSNNNDDSQSGNN